MTHKEITPSLYFTIDSIKRGGIEVEQLSMRKYKDELPKDTINKIRNIFNEIDLLPIEKSWKNSVKEIYSVHLKIENTNIFSNGKGATREYALASAYAELIERLQNQAHFRLNMNFSLDALNYKDFYYAPDESHLSIAELLNSQNDWFKKQLSNKNLCIEAEELLKFWSLLTHKSVSSDFIALPYYNLKNSSISYIPIKMINIIYGTNGMCAGNTPEEALIHGVCEVLERFAMKEIMIGNVIPPTIPVTYLKKFPEIKTMIDNIKSSGNYDIIIKDCSLNRGYPVVGLIFINKNNQTYCVNLGAHPIFEIAVERTLTEFLQGKDINTMKGAVNFSYKNDINNPLLHFSRTAKTGLGCYPNELFSQRFSYEFKEFENYRELTNKQMMTCLTKLLKKQGHDVLIRDVSFLGFPSFHIIVPGLSELYGFDDVKTIEKCISFSKILGSLKKFREATKEELEEIIQTLINGNYTLEDSITKLLDIPIEKSFPWANIKIEIFLGAAYYKLGNLEKAYESFDKFVKLIEEKYHKNKTLIAYYRCIRDYIGTRIDNLNESETIYILSRFYPSNIVQQVISYLSNQEQVFDSYGQLDCWNCERCKFKSHCLYCSQEKIYKTLKDKYFSNQIDQNHIKKILDTAL